MMPSTVFQNMIVSQKLEGCGYRMVKIS